MEQTRGACTRTSASPARSSWPGNRRISGLRDPPTIVDWVLLPATPHAVRMYMRSETASKGSDVVLPVWDTPARFLQQVEKYDSDSSGDCSEGEVGDDEEEDGARLVSAQYFSGCCRRFTDCVFCSHALLTSSLRPYPCLSQISHDSSLSSGSATLTRAL